MWMPCAAHGTDLLLGDIGKLPWVAAAIEAWRKVVIFFRKYEWSQALVREESKAGSKKELVLPGEDLFGQCLTPHTFPASSLQFTVYSML
jgi:hypothetical protein